MKNEIQRNKDIEKSQKYRKNGNNTNKLDMKTEKKGDKLS